jgi:hypothetical protein
MTETQVILTANARDVLMHSASNYSKKKKGDNDETRKDMQMHYCSVKSK